MKIMVPKLSLRQQAVPKYLACCILLLPFFFGLFIDLLGLPGALRYTLDIAWCALTLLALRKEKLHLPRKLLPLVWLAVIFLVYTLVCILFRFQSPVWYLWGLRNNFRFYAAFFAFACLLDEGDTQWLFRVLDVLFWVNIGVSLVQFFVLGYQQDFLGGIFGVERGRNAAYTIIFFLLMLSRSMLAMMNGREPLPKCLARCAAALLVAALAEMFAFFLMFLLVFLLAALCTRFSWKKCALFLAMTAAFAVCSSLLLEMFGEGSQLTLEIIFRRLFAENYATSEDLGRLTAIPTLSETILTDLPGRLFGLGLGNCDTSTFEVCNSDFYRQYSHLHYTWFLSAFLFLETGYVGLGLYLLFFLICLVQAIRRMGSGNRLYCQIAVIMSVMCMVLTFYNSALRAEGGYMAYFALALPFVRRGPGAEKSGEP